MRPSRKFITDLTLGGLLSIIFGGLLFNQILASNVANYDSFMEFLGDPSNLLFCLLMSMFILASWLMKGGNNRTVLFCWAIMVVFNSLFYYAAYYFFVNEFKNIYALCCVGLAASIPFVLVMRYRVVISILLGQYISGKSYFGKSVASNLSLAGTTDFEFDMRVALYSAFVVEFLYSLYMMIYGVLNRVPYHASITEHMQLNNVWTPYNAYFTSLNIIGTVYILVITLHLYREFKDPDAFGYGMTAEERKAAGLRLLEKSRNKNQ